MGGYVRLQTVTSPAYHCRSVSPTPADRRVHPRIPVSVEADLFKAGSVFRARMADVSMGGVRLYVAEPVGEWGDAVDLRLPVSKPVVVRGTIVRVQREGDGYSLGLRFDPLSAEEKELVATLVARQTEG